MKGTKSYLVDAAPLNKAANGTLSYFSGTKMPPGTLVRIPVRKGQSLALVVRSRDARSAKSDIRRASFELRKINKRDILSVALPPYAMHALESLARFYATTTGTLIASLVPKMILEEAEIFLASGPAKRKTLDDPSRETVLLQMESEERFGQYRAIVRQCFARGASAMLVVPTHLEVERLRRELSTGIAEFVHVFALPKGKKEAKKSWLKAVNEKHPVLLITTPAGIFFPRLDIDTVIVERENSRAYRTLARPYIHYRQLIEQMAHEAKRRLVFGDSVLSLETLWREKRGEFGESSLIRWRLPAAPAQLVDASSKQDEAGRFSIFSQELIALIGEAISEKENSSPGRIFLFGARKGLAPTTVCGDCGTALPCLNCGAPTVLHQRSDLKNDVGGPTSVYICHACGSHRDSKTTCGFCGSWKLVPLGIGTEEIAKQARAHFPDTKVQIIDKEHAPSDASAKNIAQKFEDEGGILVGTELAFFHLEKVPYAALVSVDALFSIPDFGINERLFYIVSRLREMAEKRVIIQTRNIGKQILAWGSQGNIIDFYQNEITERETLLYPPVSIFIKLTAPTGRAVALSESFAKWQPDVLKDSVIIRVSRAQWPDEELIEKISLLGREFRVKVDPESIL